MVSTVIRHWRRRGFLIVGVLAFAVCLGGARAMSRTVKWVDVEPVTPLVLQSWSPQLAEHYQRFTPPDERAKSQLSIVLRDPVELNGRTPNEWFSDDVAYFERLFSKVLRRPRVEQKKPGWLYGQRLGLTKHGVLIKVEFYGLPVSQSAARLLVVSRSLSLTYDYSLAVRALKNLMIEQADSNQVRHMRDLWKQQEEQRERDYIERTELIAARRVLPGRGLRSDAIDSVVYQLEYEADVLGGLTAWNSVYLLLKDGTAFHNPDIPPADLDVDISRKVEPNRWYQWVREDGVVRVRQSTGDAWQQLEGQVAQPGTTRHRHIAGVNLEALGASEPGSLHNRSILLTDEGRYRQVSHTLSNALDAAAGERVTDEAGNTTHGVRRHSVLTLDAERGSNSALDHTGSYEIEHFTIQFDADSGIQRRVLYMKLSDYEFYIDGVVYRTES